MDSLGIEILDSLANAVRRGVRVQLLVDGVGSFGSIDPLATFCQKNGIEFRVFHKLSRLFLGSFFLRYWNLKQNFLRFAAHANQRNHRKLTVIDGHFVFLGSQNITLFHSEKWRQALAWRDTGAKISFQSSMASNENVDPEIQFLKRSMNEVWSRTFIYRRPFLLGLRTPFPKSIFRLNSRLLWRRNNLRRLLQRIRFAEKRILITNAYFLPGYALLRSLKRASKRGVKVVLLVPAKSDVWALQQASRSLYKGLLEAGVEIYEFLPRVLHAKSLIIDDYALVGSHNFNHRSFVHDLEVDLEIKNPEVLEQLVEQWTVDISKSEKIGSEWLKSWNWLNHLIGRWTYLFRYWM